jgi:hypothetical protein
METLTEAQSKEITQVFAIRGPPDAVKPQLQRFTSHRSGANNMDKKTKERMASLPTQQQVNDLVRDFIKEHGKTGITQLLDTVRTMWEMTMTAPEDPALEAQFLMWSNAVKGATAGEHKQQAARPASLALVKA